MMNSDRTAFHSCAAAFYVQQRPVLDRGWYLKREIQYLSWTTDPSDTSKLCTEWLGTLLCCTPRPHSCTKNPEIHGSVDIFGLQTENRCPMTPIQQVIDFLRQNIDTRMVQARPSARAPLVCLWNGSSLWNRGHHTHPLPRKGLASHCPVIVTACNYAIEEHSLYQE